MSLVVLAAEVCLNWRRFPVPGGPFVRGLSMSDIRKAAGGGRRPARNPHVDLNVISRCSTVLLMRNTPIRLED